MEGLTNVIVVTGAHRARVAVEPERIEALAASLDSGLGIGGGRARWLAEIGVGTVHLAVDEPSLLGLARDAAHAHGGWLLREAGAPDLDPFGVSFPATELQRRVRQTLDPAAKLNPGRVPATEPTVVAA